MTMAAVLIVSAIRAVHVIMGMRIWRRTFGHKTKRETDPEAFYSVRADFRSAPRRIAIAAYSSWAAMPLNDALAASTPGKTLQFRQRRSRLAIVAQPRRHLRFCRRRASGR